MSERSLSESEFDLLADYTAGVLDESQAREIAGLIDRDPVWGDTHAALVAAEAPVRAALAAVAAEPMPADVVARIDAALADLAGSPAQADVPGGTVVSLDAVRARRRHWAARVIAVAAAVIGIAGGAGLASSYLRSNDQATSTGAPAMAPGTDADAGGKGSAEGAGPLPQAIAGIRLATSQTDYRTETLAQVSPSAPGLPPGFSQNDSGRSPTVPGAVRAAAPSELARLTDLTLLDQCIASVTKVHPGVATYAEYARFEGSPALIVVVRTGTGSTIVAVGPNCGRGGPDEKGAVTIP